MEVASYRMKNKEKREMQRRKIQTKVLEQAEDKGWDWSDKYKPIEGTAVTVDQQRSRAAAPAEPMQGRSWVLDKWIDPWKW